MYCANCGTQLHTSTCSVCGTVASVSGGRRDTVTNHALAEWGLRVGATIVDGFTLVVPELLIWWAVGSYTSSLFTVSALALQGFYLVYLLSRPRGQTLGNRAAKTRVASASTGQGITMSTAFMRWFITALFSFSLVFGVGVLLVPLDYLWPLWDPRRQTLHDKIAGTIVVLV